MAEDSIAIGGLLVALHYPVVFLVFLVAFVLLMIWLLPILWRALSGIFDSIRRFFSGGIKRLPER
jgi:hypothetical protein